ncbi:hypothetical protein QMZ05_24645 [Bradyrhizobium sp. INPA03-11B]
MTRRANGDQLNHPFEALNFFNGEPRMSDRLLIDLTVNAEGIAAIEAALIIVMAMLGRVRRMPERKGWSRAFDDPIELPDGRVLITLHDAATYITRLPKKESAELEWQIAISELMLAVEHNRPAMLARIGFMRALKRHEVREFNPNRKDPHWGKRKLKRDQ